MLYLTKPSKRQISHPTVLQRIAQSDKAAAKDCVNTYGSSIWAFARNNSASEAEAERLTLLIFRDIWKYAKRFNPEKDNETTFISSIARIRLPVY